MEDSTVGFNKTGDPGLPGSESGSGSPGYEGIMGVAGGIGIAGASNAEIQSSTIYANRGYNGGGIQVMNSATLLMVNSTLSDNDAAESGGGITVSGTDATLVYVTITLNAADWDADLSGGGGGFYSTGTLSLRNSWFAIVISCFNLSGSSVK